MSAVSLLLNVLWLVFGGLWMAVGWGIAAVIMAITIIGPPWARAAFNIAAYTLLPFGQKAVSRSAYTGVPDAGTGARTSAALQQPNDDRHVHDVPADAID